MKKHVFGRKLKRDRNERKALFKSLLSSLVLEERIKTSTAKAKAIKGLAEKLVTKARQKGTIQGAFFEYLTPLATTKLISVIAPRFLNRPGGYTRLVRIGNRVKDNAEMVLMEWVEKAEVKNKEKKETQDTKAKKVEKVESTAQVKKPTKKPARKTVKKTEDKK